MERQIKTIFVFLFVNFRVFRGEELLEFYSEYEFLCAQPER